VVKNLPTNAGEMGSIPESGRSPRGGNSNPFHYSCLENSTDREALEGYSPWGGKESDATDHTFNLQKGQMFN